jgi:bacterioferritin (cytochrome b1)
VADAAEIQQYSEEQARLQRERDGGPREDDFHIEAPKPPEVNPEVFKDVEPLLFNGFLYAAAEINGVSFVFKSLNHHEFERLGMLASAGRQGQRFFYEMFLAYGVLLVDGISVLPERDRWLPEIAQTFREFEESARRKVIRHLSEINRRANRAVLLTEVFALEARSRLRWAQYRGLDLTSAATTGFVGTSHLGLNWGQLTWRALNYYEDQREQIEREWENAKFIASAFTGSKGLTQVNSRDKQRRETEQSERIERRDQLLRQVLLGEGVPGEDAEKGAPMKVARSVEELADQLEKDLKGEKDWHDQVVEAHEQRARNQYQTRIDRLREMREAHIKQFGPHAVVGGTDQLSGLTPDEVKQRIEQRHQGTLKRLAQTRQAYPEIFDPKLGQFMDKWAGGKTPDQRELREVAPVVVADRPKVVPFKRGRD